MMAKKADPQSASENKDFINLAKNPLNKSCNELIVNHSKRFRTRSKIKLNILHQHKLSSTSTLRRRAHAACHSVATKAWKSVAPARGPLEGS